MIVGIVGSRHYKPFRLVNAVVDRLEHEADTEGDVLTVVSGGEPTGVDGVVEDVCRSRGYHVCSDDPDTLTHLPAPRHIFVILPENGSARAKFARNSKVVRHVGMVIALYGGRERSPGTSDTVAKARKIGLPVHEHLNGRWQ